MISTSFFQAVSNSSWANEGYLAAAEISIDEEFRDELLRLSSSFGIGIIELDTQDPDASEILFPAQEKDQLDWDMVNKLTMNRDFNEFLARIKRDIEIKEVRREKYDRIPTREDLIKKFSKKDK